MAYYNYKELRDSLPPEMVDKWAEEDGSTDYDSTLWCYAADYIDQLTKERDESRRERDEAQAAFVVVTDQLVVAQSQARQWRQCAERLADGFLRWLPRYGTGSCKDGASGRAALAEFDRLKEASK